MFNKTFYHFFFAFVAIIAVAFGVLIWTGMQQPPSPVNPVVNVANP